MLHLNAASALLFQLDASSLALLDPSFRYNAYFSPQLDRNSRNSKSLLKCDTTDPMC